MTELVSCSAEPVEQVPNWYIWLRKISKFFEKIPKWIRNLKKSTVLNSKPG